MNEENQFLEELKETPESDPFGEVEIPQEEPKEEPTDPDDPEAQPESVKDRRHRRLEAKLQAEREANIALAARLETLAEANKSKGSEAAEYLKQVERIYGTDTPEAVAATEILKDALKSAEDRATERALETFREEQRKQAEDARKAEQELDSMIEEIEDEYGVTLTPEMQKGFFTYLEKLSPKDKEGNVVEYADHHAVWEEYKSKLTKKPDNRAKDLAARSMTQSGASGESRLQIDATERFLKENGLI